MKAEKKGETDHRNEGQKRNRRRTKKDVRGKFGRSKRRKRKNRLGGGGARARPKKTWCQTSKESASQGEKKKPTEGRG